jgi:hypothetical protein
MSTQVQIRKGNTIQTAAFTGAIAELTVDTDKKTLVVHDGVTAGGIPLARESALSANQVFSQAAFNAANSAATLSAATDLTQNNSIAAAFLAANSAVTLSDAIDLTQNTSITASFIAANSSGVYANAAFIHANASFAFANTISGGAAIDNVARVLANSAATLSDATDLTQNNSIAAAFTQANTGVTNAAAASSYANAAFLAANSAATLSDATDATQNANITLVTNTATAAFLAANTAATLSDATDATQNNSIAAAFTQANTAVLNAGNASIYANGAFLAANSAATLSAATDATQNTNITNAQNTADAAFLAANTAATLSDATDATQNNSIAAAFTRANNSISANAGGTITGDLVVTGNLTISGQTTYANTISVQLGDNIITLNSETPTSLTPTENAGIEVNRGNTFANSSLLWIESSGKWQANSGSLTGAYFLADESVVTAAFLAANSAATLSAATDATQNANITSVTNTAAAAFLAANSAATLSAATDATQNTNITNAQNTGDAAFLAANSAATLSAATDATQNNSITAAFLAANSAATLSAATDATQNNSIAAAFTQANSVYLPSVTRLDVTNSGASAYLFDQYTGNNPELYIRAGETLAFNLNVTGHPFLIRVSNGGSNYSNGLTHVTTTGTVTTGSSAQGQVAGTLYWKVPAELAGNTYVYQCQVHGGMVGNIVIERPNHDFTNISVAAGTYGNATHYGVVSVAANGRVTSVSTFPVVDSSAIAFSIALG